MYASNMLESCQRLWQSYFRKDSFQQFISPSEGHGYVTNSEYSNDVNRPIPQ